jgi:hypothetical protein
VPSGWTNSGIDWENIRDNRTEEVVNHLYLATNERDYWVKHFSNLNSVISSIDTVGRRTTNDSLRYMFNTIQRWLLPFDEFPNVTTSPQLLTNQCCFLDELSPLDPLEVTTEFSTDYFPYKPYNRWFGLKNLDYSDGGELESILGYSLSFFRSPYNSRNSLQFMNFVYDFLQLKLKVANVFSEAYTPSTFSPGNGRHGQTPYQFSDTSSDFIGFRYSRRGNVGGSSGDSQTKLDLAIDLYNADVPQYIPNALLGSKEDARSFTFNNGNGNAFFGHEYSYVKYLAQGFDGNTVNMADLEVLLRTVTYNEKDISDEFFNYMPKGDWPLGDNSISPIVENVNGLDVVRVTSKINDPLPYTTIGTPSIDYRDEVGDNTVIPFLSINIEGFLNYYTEP